ncbi:NACHT domain-containing NTPase [Dolichospermum sp. UHCC 0259]|uniref:NACHT domain-containing protein n=1 Tax=Dolichospermum sp. UHCC 0259 TaxID=2590010 RepID=UPI0014452684|nr:NACHT domain-containing protein [Dolichospermum sp. UHCC 0259]MTJ50087.1 NACHT domain-containing protein [Dolichospermum sp. UHCC 0259]
MSQYSPSEEPPSSQNLEIGGNASLEKVQVGGIAGRDLYVNQIQVQGGSVSVTIYDRLLTSDGLSSPPNISAPPVTQTQEEFRYRKSLLNRVKKIWIEGILEKSLHKQVLSELRLQEEKSSVLSQVSSSQNFTDESIALFPKEKEGTEVLPNIGEGRTLLILGDPGSGKTTILLKMAKSLIDDAEKDLHKLVPVVFKLSSWTNKKLTIAEWLVEELQEQYSISKKDLTKNWIRNQKLILLFDGLDEVQKTDRNVCVQALNKFTTEHEITDVVVSCRIQEYRKLSEQLKLQSIINIQPLTDQQIDEQLDQAGNKLVALKSLIQQDNKLRKLAKSPLILSVMSLTYQNYTLEAVRQETLSENFYSVLFKNYINRMLLQKPIIATKYTGIGKQVIIFAFYLLIQPSKSHLHRYDTKSYRLGKLLLYDDRYSRPQLINWLIWLAQRMFEKSQTIFLIEKIQPNWLESRTQKRHYYLTVLMITEIISSSLGLIHIPLQPVDNWKYALATGILSGFCVPLYYVWDYFLNKNKEEIRLVEKLDWSWKERLNNLSKYLPLSLIIGFIVALPSAWLEMHGIIDLYKAGIEKNIIHHANSINLAMLLSIYTFLVSVFILFIFGFTSDIPPKEISRELYPNQGIFISLQNTLFIGLTDWIISVLFFFLIGYYIQMHPIIQAIKYAVSYGFMGAVLFAICSSSGKTCIKHFALRVILYQNKLIPWNYAKFLDDTSELLFLQKVGIGYEFFHQEFRDYLSQLSQNKKHFE